MALSDPFDNTPPVAIALSGQSFNNTPPEVATVPNSTFDNTEPEELILTSFPIPAPIGLRPVLAFVPGPQVTAAVINTGTGYTDVTVTALPFPDRLPDDEEVSLEIRVRMPSDMFDEGAVFGGLPTGAGIKSFYYGYPKGDGGYEFSVRYVTASTMSEWSQPFPAQILLG